MVESQARAPETGGGWTDVERQKFADAVRQGQRAADGSTLVAAGAVLGRPVTVVGLDGSRVTFGPREGEPVVLVELTAGPHTGHWGATRLADASDPAGSTPAPSPQITASRWAQPSRAADSRASQAGPKPRASLDIDPFDR
jgi:hypothetical protein